jgi:hypothetical protein
MTNLKFNHAGETFEFNINFKDSSEWVAVHGKGKIFDVDYDESYNQISVYEVINGQIDYTTTIHKQPIK